MEAEDNKEDQDHEVSKVKLDLSVHQELQEYLA